MKKIFVLLPVIIMIIAACGTESTPTQTLKPTRTSRPTQRHEPPQTPTPAPAIPNIEILGEPEVVFTWVTERCADDQLADLPTRAIRMADGRIQLFISSTTNYRLVGDDFDSLTADCSPVFESTFDRNPANYNHSEWIAAPYTLDGQTIYAIIHQEFHGDQAGSTWQADVDLSDLQGHQNWSYHSWDGSVYYEMTYNPTKNEWVGFQPLCLIFPNGMHPDINCSPTRTWTSPISGEVTVNGSVYDLGLGGGNGVAASIFKGEDEIWSAVIKEGDRVGQQYNLEVKVNEGDQIHFRVDALGDAGFDATEFNPGINLGPPPCPSNRHDMCTLISLTHAVSSDGGSTFTQSQAPDHLVAAFPYRYDSEWMRAIWQPSNIVRNPKDGLYYALIQFDEHSSDYSTTTQGMCLIRTQTLEDPTSWRAWDGSSFSMQFINPYKETTENPAEHTCHLVSPEIGALTYGLSYNSYLEQYIAVGVGFEGFYFSVSEDLIHWSPRQFIMEAPQTFTPDAEPPYLPYPTLIDHDSPSPSFDVTGQTPYLYFSRMNEGKFAYNMDILRVQVEFSK